MVGDLVDPIPGDGLTALRVPPQKLDLLRVLGAIHPVSRCMATHTGRHRRNSGALGAFHSEVAVLAINLKITSMLVVGGGDRLTGGAGYGGNGRLRLLGPGFLPGQDESESPEEGNSRRKYDGPPYLHGQLDQVSREGRKGSSSRAIWGGS
jgi:hypothetical protein